MKILNFLGFNLSLNRKSKGEADLRQNHKSLDLSVPWMTFGPSAAHAPVLSNAYEQVVWVYRAINVLAEQVANIPFVFSRGARGRESIITSGPLHAFYDRPHPHLNRFSYWELRVIWLMLRGECFRVPIFGTGRNGRRILTAVLILDPARFQHIVQDDELIGWRYTGSSSSSPLSSQVLLPDEVWFEKLPNPFDFWRGLSPLSVAAAATQTDFAAAAFMRGLLENNGDLGLIVRTDQPLGDEQQEQILARLRERKRRAGAADRPLLLWSGAEVIAPQLSSVDLQFLENRKFSRAEICAAFGVPEEIVTITDNSKYDVMAGSRLNFIENRIAPLCARLEAAENCTTIPALLSSAETGTSAFPRPSDGRGIKGEGSSASLSTRNSELSTAVGWFDLDSLPILQEARRTRLQSAKIGFEMGIPFNDLNEVLDLGFKPSPGGDTGYLKNNLVPLPKS